MSLIGYRSRNHPQQTAVRTPSLFAELDGPETDETDDRGTDPALFAMFERQHHFTVDAAASSHNAKCERYWTMADDGLAQPWNGERVWCNPPFSALAPWVAKAHKETGALIVMLLPANRTEQRWWQTWIEPYRDRGDRLSIRFLLGRPRFVPRLPTDRGDRPPFGLCVATWV